MSKQPHPPSQASLGDRYPEIVVALSAADQAAAGVTQARRNARAHRALLASAIRAAADAEYGTVIDFCRAVEAKTGIPNRSVWNALYSTFSSDYLARCIEVLAQARLGSGDGAAGSASVQATGRVRQAA